MSLNGKEHFIFKDGGGKLCTVSGDKTGIYLNEDFKLKLRSNCIYIGKVKNTSSQVEITNDRIVFTNIHNPNVTAKYNITVPFNEIIALRYCFTSDISIFVIQPIFDSYLKLSNWIKNSSCDSSSVGRIIPENFIMVNFDNPIDKQNMAIIQSKAKEYNKTIKIIEINSNFAHQYFKTPNKLNLTRSSNNWNTYKNNVKNIPTKPVTEVIHLDDDDDEDEGDKTTNESSNNLLNSVILRYPKTEAKPIILYGQDLNCLRDGHYLNDNIMNFYLKYNQYSGNILSQDIVDKIHIYDALFATHLLNQHSRKRKFSLSTKYVVYAFDSMDKAYHLMLKKWTKDIDIFSKDFLIIPLIKDSHWFLIILCYIGNFITDSTGVVKSVNQVKNEPTIIFMDSLNTYSARNDICRTIFAYLSLELKEKRGLSMPSGSGTFKELYPKVPQQQNYYDCGLFVLEYIERFLKAPEKTYRSICENSTTLQNWFNPKILDTKRAKIRQTILNLLPPENAAKLESELVKINLDQYNGDDGIEDGGDSVVD